MKTKFLLSALLIGAFLSSCNDDEEPDPPVIENEEEVITTLRYTLIPDNAGDTVVFSFQDLDGDGSNPAVIMEDSLDPNTTYSGAIELLNESGSPVEDITEEVEEEADEHQLFFTTPATNVAFSYDDVDGNNLPLGLMTTVTTQGSGSALVTVTLRHEPEKTASGVSSGDITNAGGETDIEVDFTFIVR